MTNRHFGNVADVWKHLVLCEVLTLSWPQRYAETHAGSAIYALDGTGPEKEYGVRRFLAAAGASGPLAESAYAALVRPDVAGPAPAYPGSALQAMRLLGESVDYLLCDTDPVSAAGLREWAERLDRPGCRVEQRDGMTALEEWLGDDLRPTIVHIDPFDPMARLDGGRSALDVAGLVAEAGAGLVYWYGYDTPAERGWPLGKLGELTSSALWCGDVLVTDGTGATRSDGNLGDATTPGTGFGIVLANVTTDTHVACAGLGEALTTAYDGVTLPSGEAGRLAVEVIAS